MRSMCLALAALSLMGCSFASEAIPAEASSASALEERDLWQDKQVVLRQVVRVEVPGAAGPTTTWLFWERTPHRRLKIAAAPTPEGDPQFIFLQQEDTSMVMEGQDANLPAAPWMLGVKLFDELLEPAMLQSWTLGLPGRSVLEGSEPAQVVRHNGVVQEIRQDGWVVTYTNWQAAAPDRPSLPREFQICKNDRCANIMTVISEAHTAPPPKYSEFSIW